MADTALLHRARIALRGGPLAGPALLQQVLSTPSASERLAERLLRALFGDHPEFERTAAGAWRLAAAVVGSEAPAGRAVPDVWSVAPAGRATASPEPGPSVVGRSAGLSPQRGVGLLEMSFSVVDVETTGGGVTRGHRMTEFAAVPVDGGVVGEPFTTLLNPGRPIPRVIVALTGITQAMVSTAPRFGDVAGEVMKSMRGRVFAAHNAAFDWRFTSAEFERSRGESLVGDRLCTVRLARLLLPHLRRRSLDSVAHYFDIPINDRHRAYGDALATAHILVRLLGAAAEKGWGTWPALQRRLERGTSPARTRRSALPTACDTEPA